MWTLITLETCGYHFAIAGLSPKTPGAFYDIGIITNPEHLQQFFVYSLFLLRERLSLDNLITS
ncbi:MAG: hypothetical protein BA865_01740 [Desulfobacterales bacterium S5133MH4]|nr:MAG: hypothetical protein BA865_01740 [Desulfobacterales bacterium S5133MH4]